MDSLQDEGSETEGSSESGHLDGAGGTLEWWWGWVDTSSWDTGSGTWHGWGVDGRSWGGLWDDSDDAGVGRWHAGGICHG
jgi:hypothetical protein